MKLTVEAVETAPGSLIAVPMIDSIIRLKTKRTAWRPQTSGNIGLNIFQEERAIERSA
jgi:hypothetical protein